MIWFVVWSAALAWDPLPVADDPLVRMPGTQPADGVQLESPGLCVSCHANYDPVAEPMRGWRGSMMAQSARDPLFWAATTVALQDSLWSIGRPNAGDLCLRCHLPEGWYAGRSDPPNGAAMVGSDHDGVHCDACHRMVDPFHAERALGVRESNDWVGYWDESGAGPVLSSTEAQHTLDRDKDVAATLTLFSGLPMYDIGLPSQPGWTEAASGQLLLDPDPAKRGPFVDHDGRHPVLYSRFHKSREACASCHDVSNPVLANLAFEGTAPGDGVTVLPSESQPAYALPHVERTWSEFASSDFGLPGGAPGTGAFAPGRLQTAQAGDAIATCQDCHMRDVEGRGCNFPQVPFRPSGSLSHPRSGAPSHRIAGGNAWVPWLLASTVPGSPVYDPFNEALLAQGPGVLTLDLYAGMGLDADALLEGQAAALQMLGDAASIEQVTYDPATGALAFRVVNHSGHKLPTGYPEGRRAFVTIDVWQGGVLRQSINRYDGVAGTLVGQPDAAPPLPTDRVVDALVYEARPSSTLTGESHTFHLSLADGRFKDNRIPPRGFRLAEAAARDALPAANGQPDASLFTPAEYAGGYDEVTLTVPTGADRIDIALRYQTTSREYVAFLRDEITGTGGTLTSPTPSGEPEAYVVDTDPFFDGLRAWGTVIWQLWEHNRHVPGAAPVTLADGGWGCRPEVPGDGVDQDCDGFEQCFVDADLDGARRSGTQPSADLTCATSGLAPADAPLDCWDADASLDQADADQDGWSTCDGDCDDADPAVTACPTQPWLTGAWPAHAGDPLTFTVSGVPPAYRVALVAGRPAGTTPVPGCGGSASVDLSNAVLVGTARPDAQGRVQITVTAPPPAAGRTFAFQAVALGACRPSNRLVRTVQGP